VVHSGDDQEVGMAHKSKITRTPASIFPDDDGAVLVKPRVNNGEVKLSPNKLSDQPEMLSKGCHGIKKII